VKPVFMYDAVVVPTTRSDIFRARIPNRFCYAYDANGNTLSDSSGKQYSWDFENRLTSATVPGTGTTTFRYDPFGRRVQKSGPLGTTNYLYDGPNAMEELDGAGNVLARYTHGTVVDEPLAELRSGATSYYHADNLGSVTSLTDSTGTVANTYTYDGYGKVSASTGTLSNPFRFNGHEFDSETQLHFYRARYYDQSVGRFISEDPFGFSGSNDFYVYVDNSPTNLIDPLGLQTKVPGSETPFSNPNIQHYNCLAWGLGINSAWIQPSDPNASPNSIMPLFGCKKVPCDQNTNCKKRVRVNIYEDSADPNNWHVERQTCGGSWTSKNGQSFLYNDIADPDAFYNQSYHPSGNVNKTCWSCPAKPQKPNDPRVTIAP
jgi:RHS repeat-associated protein